MRKHLLLLIPLLLALPMALSGCGEKGNVRQYVPVQCPQPPSVPAPLMQPPPKPLRTASKLQSLLFEPATLQTPASASSVRR